MLSKTSIQQKRRAILGWLRLLVHAHPQPQDLGLLGLGFIAAIAAGTPMPILGIVFGQLMDDFNSATCRAPSSSPAQKALLRESINSKIVIVVGIAVANLVLIYIYNVSWNLFGQRLAQRTREHYLREMLRKEVAFFDRMSPGEMANNLDSDINTIKQGTSQKVGVVIYASSFFVTAYIIAFIKDAYLGGILVALTPAYLIMSAVGGHFIGMYTKAMSKAVASASNVAFEALSNITLIQAFGADERLAGSFSNIMLGAKAAGISKAVTASIQAGFLFFIAYSANATAYYVGSRQIADAVQDGGSTTVGTIYTVIFILVDAAIILSTVAPFLQLFGAAQAAFEKLEKNVEGSAGKATPYSPNVSPVNPSISLRDVCFAYPSQEDTLVLRNVQFQMAAGKNTAVVGPSGSGKSTIAGLLLRLYSPTSGEIFLGETDIKNVDADGLRSRISIVQQDATLFDRSILENVALGLVNSSKHRHLTDFLLSGKLVDVARRVRDGSDIFDVAKGEDRELVEIVELVIQAAGRADAHRFIENFQNGYGTIVGSKGTLISGGQKQRIALARALVKDPDILILDEATASLDSISEQRIQKALKAASSGRTTLTIAHRLSTIKDADHIVVMQSGRVVEQGTHDDLVAANGIYSGLIRLQSASRTDGSKESELPSEDAMADDLLDEEETVREDRKPGGKASANASAQAGDDPEIGVKRSVAFILSVLNPMLRPSLPALVIAFAAMLVVGGTYSASALIFGHTIGALSPCNEPDDIRRSGRFFALMFFTLAIVELFANMISWTGFGLASERLLYKIRLRAFRSLVSQDQGWQESNHRSLKSLLSLITADCNAIGGLTGSTVGTILSILVNMIAAIILTHMVAWKIAIVCLAVVPIIMGVGAMHLITLARFHAKHASSFRDSVSIAVEAVESIKTVKTLSLQTEILHTYCRSLRRPTTEMTKQSVYSYMWLAMAQAFPTFLFSLSLWWGGGLMIAGEYTQVQYYICTIALLVSAQLWGQLFVIAPDVSKAFEAVRRVINLFDLTSPPQGPNHPDAESAISAPTEKPITPPVHPSNPRGTSITFTGVTFTYPARPTQSILRNLSLHIPPGTFAALVGPSGAGKSTIFSLIERVYHPSCGSITLDSAPLATLPHSFRDTIAYVPQTSVLFSGTIRFNLSLGAPPSSPAPSNADLEAACRTAAIHDTITALPHGYNSPCGSASGTQFSGGELQRLAVARALVRRPRLLLLDEATAALDGGNEEALRVGLEKVRRETGMTVVAIAHRLSTVRRAERIFMVEGGRVVDWGGHAELLGRCREYRDNAIHQGF